MPKLIHDAFALLKISPQERHKLRHKSKGVCSQCPNLAEKGYSRCPSCRKRHNDYVKRKRRAQALV